jgi:hypothetical protein
VIKQGWVLKREFIITARQIINIDGLLFCQIFSARRGEIFFLW